MDIGPTLPGWTDPADTGFTLHGAGADIWNQSDEFRFVYRPLTGDGAIIALVSNLQYTNDWSKAGLMIRESLAGNSKHASAFLTGTSGAAFQYRSSTGAESTHVAGPSTQGPIWLKVQRQGSTLTGSYSWDGVNWATLGQISISMSSTAYIGLALTSHTPSAYASADFTSVFQSESSTSSQSSSSAWSDSDIGAVALPGSSAITSTLVSIKASGTDVWDNSDEFHFVYRQLTGDGVVIARVANFSATDAWSKAGVMIRESLAPDSKHAFMLVSGSEGLAFQRRAVATGGWTDHTAGSWATAPVWVKLQRSGSTISASSSGDGVNWTPVGSDTISMNSTVYVGLAVVSHTMWAYAAADFSNISITSNVSITSGSGSGGGGGSGGSSTVSGWTSGDIGSPTLAGSTSAIASGLSIRSASADIWNTSDQFRFVYQQLSGDGTIVAFMSNLQYADAWSKAGVMIRESLAANSKHAFAMITGTQGLAFQRRTATGGMSTHTGGPTVGQRIWLKLQRRGTTLTASYSYDRVNWATIGSDTIAMNSTVYAGLALSSRSTIAYATADFTDISLSGSTSTLSGNQSPTVSLTSPSFGATFAAGSTIQLTATASDPDGSIARVDFYAGTTSVGSDSSSPYSVNWTNVPAGMYSLTAVARDNAGATTVSSEQIISVTSTSLSWHAVFTPSDNQATAVNHYVLEIFPSGTDPNITAPVATLDLGLPPIVNGVCDVSIVSVVSALQPGWYIGTVTAIGSGGSARSEASSPFAR